MFIKPSFKIIDSSLRIIVGPFDGESYDEADVRFFRDTTGMALTGSIVSPIGRYRLKQTMSEYRHLTDVEWKAEYSRIGKDGLDEARTEIKSLKEYEAFLKNKENE